MKPIRLFILIALVGTAVQDLSRHTQIIGSERLVSMKPLTETGGEVCLPETLMAALQPQDVRTASTAAKSTGDTPRSATILERPPVRTIRDSRPTYSAVAVDVK